MQFETAIRVGTRPRCRPRNLNFKFQVVIQFADVRVLAFGVRNTPKSSFSVNDNAWRLFHPPAVWLPSEIEQVSTDEPGAIEDEVEGVNVHST